MHIMLFYHLFLKRSFSQTERKGRKTTTFFTLIHKRQPKLESHLEIFSISIFLIDDFTLTQNVQVIGQETSSLDVSKCCQDVYYL